MLKSFFKTTENELQDAFFAIHFQHRIGKPYLMMDRMTNRPRGFGFVTMSSDEEAQKAIEGLHGKDVGGRALTVNVARPAVKNARAAVVVVALWWSP